MSDRWISTVACKPKERCERNRWQRGIRAYCRAVCGVEWLKEARGAASLPMQPHLASRGDTTTDSTRAPRSVPVPTLASFEGYLFELERARTR